MRFSIKQSGQFYIGISIRLLQLVFTIILLGLGAGLVNRYSSWLTLSRPNFIVAIAVIDFVYLVAITLVYRWNLVLVPFIGDIILSIFWLAGFASIADVWGSLSCSRFSSSTYRDSCRIAKAIIAFGVINWVLFGISAILLSLFTIFPYGFKAEGFYAKTGVDCIFPSAAVAAADPTVNDLELSQKEEGSKVAPTEPGEPYDLGATSNLVDGAVIPPADDQHSANNEK